MINKENLKPINISVDSPEDIKATISSYGIYFNKMAGQELELQSNSRENLTAYYTDKSLILAKSGYDDTNIFHVITTDFYSFTINTKKALRVKDVIVNHIPNYDKNKHYVMIGKKDYIDDIQKLPCLVFDFDKINEVE